MEQANPSFLLVSPEHTPDSPARLYLDLLKRSLTRAVFAKDTERYTLAPDRPAFRAVSNVIQSLLKPLGCELVRLRPSTVNDYVESSHAGGTRTEGSETMIGLKQLDQMQACIEDVVASGVPGDLVEAGVWKGGMTIFMRGALKALGDTQRRVWVADSFEGLPDPVHDSFGWQRGDMSISMEAVQENFQRYGLLDEQVVFLKGFFSDSLPRANIDAISVLRVDADLYGSTLDALHHLYPKLSMGGYAIFDDYQNLADCRRAVDEYRRRHGIEDAVVPIDRNAAYWIKSSAS